jgi:hypothetical protein
MRCQGIRDCSGLYKTDNGAKLKSDIIESNAEFATANTGEVLQ